MNPDDEQPGSTQTESEASAAPNCLGDRDRKHLGRSFDDAFNGVSALYRTQPHVRIYLVIGLVALLLSAMLHFGPLELVLLSSAILILFIAESLNTAIEATVDLAIQEEHPLAKIAKDCGAAAVLFAVSYALLVGVVLFANKPVWKVLSRQASAHFFDELTRTGVMELLALGSAVLFIIILVGKGEACNANLLKGGAVSGHAALAFFFATAVALVAQQVLVTLLAYLLALLTAQSRVDARIHSVREAILGALAGTTVCFVVFMLWPH